MSNAISASGANYVGSGSTPDDPEKQLVCAYAAEIRIELQIVYRRNLVLEQRVGVLVNEARAKSKYGDAVIDSLAKELDESPGFLRRLATRAATFGQTKLDELLELANLRAFKLGSSHLDEVVSMHDESTRDSLLQRCINEGWRVQKLRSEVTKAEPRRGNNQAARNVPAKVKQRTESFIGFLKGIVDQSQFRQGDTDWMDAMAVLRELHRTIADYLDDKTDSPISTTINRISEIE
jgi:hypothetical protein